MTITTIARKTDAKGRPFQLVVDVDNFKSWLNAFINAVDVPENEEDEEDDSIAYCDLVGYHDTHPTLEQRLEDKEELKKFLALIEDETYWQQILDKADTKANGTLSKNRVNVLFRLNTFGRYWEDSYGWNTPEIRMKNTADDTAEIQFDYYIVKY